MAKGAYLSPGGVDSARQRRLKAMQLQAIAGNLWSVEQVAMFELFEREAWPHDRRLAYTLTRPVPVVAE